METDNLNLIIARLHEKDNNIINNATNMLVDLVKSSHSGSISTLSFQVLSERKYDLLDLCSKLENEQSKKIFDIISAISIIGDDEDILRYRILGNVISLKEWGHLYVKKLIGCIVDSKLKKNKIDFDETYEVVQECKDFLFQNNLEFDAIDFLLEIKDIENIVNYVDIHNYKRIIKYLGEMSVFYDLNDILVKIYLKTKDYTRYIINLIEQNFIDEAIEFVKKVDDKMVKRQLLYVLARLNIFYDTKILDEKVILSNNHIKDIYTQLINIYELNSDKTKTSMLNKLKYEKDAKNIQQNSFNAITVCNGFINLGYSHDTIFFPAEESVNDGFDYQTVLNSNIPELITIIASVGCIEFWNPSKVLEILQEHIFGEISIKKTGALLALALSSSKIYDENSTILSLLTNNLQSNDPLHVIPTLMGIQTIYCNANDEDLKKLLIPLLYSENQEISFFAAFTLGSLFVGSADDELISIFLQMYIEKEEYVDSHFFKMLMLGIALLFYRRPDVECCLETMETNYAKHGAILVKGFQFLKTGDPQVVEHLLSEAFCGETDALLESIALLSCSLIGIGDELATQMISRICASSLILESTHLKSVLPLCYALMYPSSPQSTIIDFLERNINCGDINVSISSMFALGVIGAGTVSGRLQKIIDSQYTHFYKDFKAITMLRISNGLLSLGKGLTSISYNLYDKSCIVPKNFIGLFATTFLMFDTFSSPLFKGHTYLFYLLNQSFVPKYMYTEKKVHVRIGLPVSTVGIVGDPKTISSMQTHTTPVILNCTERAEIDESSYTTIFEDVVLLKDN